MYINGLSVYPLLSSGEKAIILKTMRLHALAMMIIALCGMPCISHASNPGDACTVLGAQERNSGQILICNGTTWIETIQTVNAGRSLFQVGVDSSTTCQSYETGRMRYASTGAITAPTTSGLVGYWAMDETAGTTIADSSGNANTGTMFNMDGNTDHVAGYIGNGLDFDGTNDYVNAGSGASLDDLGDMSVCVWSYTRPVLTGTFATIIYKYDPGGVNGWDMYYGGAAHSMGGAGVEELFSAVAEGWNHYCAVNTNTGNNSNSITIYMNSTPVVDTAVHTNWGTSSNNAAYNAYIGGGSSADPFNGIIDELRVYNRPLSAEEVRTIYNYTGTISTVWQYCNGSTWTDF